MTADASPAATTALARWNSWSLATQFAVAGGVVMLIAMLIVGRWVATRIEAGVVRNTANATAQYMESFISPLSQDLAKSDSLSPVARRALAEIFADTPLGERVVSFKLWKPGGLVVEASDKSLVGQRFEVDAAQQAAWDGTVSASFEQLSDVESSGENALGLPLLEIYSPIREVWSGRIIGVAEFYEVASELTDELAAARRNSWAAVALVMLALGSSLYAIVLRGSRTIDQQRAALTRQLDRLTELSQHNTTLRLRVQGAASRASAMNELSLRQIGADLHDGPAQLMGFAALRLDALRSAVTGDAAASDLSAVDRAVKDAIREIRSISRGLSLPDIEVRPVPDLLQGLADAHAARTGTSVALSCELPPDLRIDTATRICLYRFVQEGLTNAWRHAGGLSQEVRLQLSSGQLILTVSDGGPGFAPAPETPTPDSRPAGPAAQTDVETASMGLAGLRDRIESLGGTFEAGRSASGGAQISMTLDAKDRGWTPSES